MFATIDDAYDRRINYEILHNSMIQYYSFGLYSTLVTLQESDFN